MGWQPRSHLSHEASTNVSLLFAVPGVGTLRGDFVIRMHCKSNVMNTRSLCAHAHTHTRRVGAPLLHRLGSPAARSPCILLHSLLTATLLPSQCPQTHPCSSSSSSFSSPPFSGNARQELLMLPTAFRLSLEASQWHGSICHPKAEAQASRTVPLSGPYTAAAGKSPSPAGRQRARWVTLQQEDRALQGMDVAAA